MNVLDLIEKSKTAKPKGKPFVFKDVTFFFRALNRDEFTKIMGESAMKEIQRSALQIASAVADTEAPEQAQKMDAVVSVMTRVLEYDLLVGWQGLTIRLYQDIANLDLDYPEERLDEVVELNDRDAVDREKANQLLRTMAQNMEFAGFCVQSAFSAMNQRTAEIAEKKRT